MIKERAQEKIYILIFICLYTQNLPKDMKLEYVIYTRRISKVKQQQQQKSQASKALTKHYELTFKNVIEFILC